MSAFDSSREPRPRARGAVALSIGPVPMGAARAWLTQARAALERAGSLPPAEMPPASIVERFEALLDEWGAAVDDERPMFEWNAVVPAENVRTMASHWASVASAFRDQRVVALDAPPPEARDFYDAIVAGVTHALAAIDNEHFVETFSEVVPGFDERLGATPAPPALTRVLIVDDTEDMRILCSVALRTDVRFEVCGQAVDGVDAVEQATELQPDAILLDVAMPRMDGITALPRLRDACPGVRIVVHSADAHNREAAMAAGADLFLTKGVPRAALAEALLGES